MAAGEDALDVLRSIDTTLKAMLSLAQLRTAKARAAAPKDIASDRDLDGKHGDPVVNMKDPRDWTGPTMKGSRFSDCPADYLDLLADRFDYFAQKAEDTNEEYNGKPVAPFRRKDAARARGWAKRIRDGKHTPGAASSAGAETGSEWAGSQGDWR